MPRIVKPRPLVSELFAHRFGLDADPKVAEPPQLDLFSGLAAESLGEEIAARHPEVATDPKRPTIGTSEPDEVLLEPKKHRRVVIVRD